VLILPDIHLLSWSFIFLSILLSKDASLGRRYRLSVVVVWLFKVPLVLAIHSLLELGLFVKEGALKGKVGLEVGVNG
jgi:hypothetical protein